MRVPRRRDPLELTAVPLDHGVLEIGQVRIGRNTRRRGLGALRKLVDGVNRPLLEPSLQAGVPDTLLGNPVVTDPYVAALGTPANAIAFGDFSAYYVRDVGLRFEASRDYAFNTDMMTYRIIRRLDGALVDTNAVKIGRSPTT